MIVFFLLVPTLVPNTQSIGIIHLALTQTISTCCEHCIASTERLRACACTLQNLTLGHSLLTRQVICELHQITLEALYFIGGNKAENIHLPIFSIVQFPASPSQRHSGYWAACCGDGTRTTKCGEPDHDLVLGRTAGCGGSEEVIGHVCDDVGA